MPPPAARPRDRIPAATRPRYAIPSFSLANRLYRATFALAWLILCRWTPPFCRAWRRAVLRAFGARLASTANVYASAAVWSPAQLEMREHACIGPGVIVYSLARVTLEAHALVSQRAHLCAGARDVDDPDFPLQARPIVIGERAWIASEAFVGPGVRVGAGAVLGARGVAMKDLAAWTVYAGNPAKALRARRGAPR